MKQNNGGAAKEWGNRDWGWALAEGEFGRIKTMAQSIDAHEIVQTCSPRHVETVLEDMRMLIIGLTIKLGEK